MIIDSKIIKLKVRGEKSNWKLDVGYDTDKDKYFIELSLQSYKDIKGGNTGWYNEGYSILERKYNFLLSIEKLFKNLDRYGYEVYGNCISYFVIKEYFKLKYREEKQLKKKINEFLNNVEECINKSLPNNKEISFLRRIYKKIL